MPLINAIKCDRCELITTNGVMIARDIQSGFISAYPLGFNDAPLIRNDEGEIDLELRTVCLDCLISEIMEVVIQPNTNANEAGDLK